MKRHIAEKNGFPKPVGMLIIMVVIIVSSFVNLFFTGDSPSSPFQETQQVIEASSSNQYRV